MGFRRSLVRIQSPRHVSLDVTRSYVEAFLLPEGGLSLFVALVPFRAYDSVDTEQTDTKGDTDATARKTLLEEIAPSLLRQHRRQARSPRHVLGGGRDGVLPAQVRAQGPAVRIGTKRHKRRGS